MSWEALDRQRPARIDAAGRTAAAGTPGNPLAGPDGTVVPGALIRELLAAGTAVLRDGIERRGHVIGGELADLAKALRALQVIEQQRGSGDGTVAPQPETMNSASSTGIAEVAARLGCSKEYARRLARAGRLRARRLDGRHWIIEIGDEAA